MQRDKPRRVPHKISHCLWQKLSALVCITGRSNDKTIAVSIACTRPLELQYITAIHIVLKATHEDQEMRSNTIYIAY